MKCTKVPYTSRDKACMVRKKLDKKKGILLQVYKCSDCKKWHLGNSPYTRLENLNRIFDSLPLSDRAFHS